MEKILKEERIKELNSRKKWEKVENGFWFMFQTFMLSMGLETAIAFFIKGLGLELEITWYFPIACLLLVIMLQVFLLQVFLLFRSVLRQQWVVLIPVPGAAEQLQQVFPVGLPAPEMIPAWI